MPRTTTSWSNTAATTSAALPSLIERYGEDAPHYAAARTAVSPARADAKGADVWRQIIAAVEELQRERRPGEAVN
jgi:hypothetical protein